MGRRGKEPPPRARSERGVSLSGVTDAPTLAPPDVYLPSDAATPSLSTVVPTARRTEFLNLVPEGLSEGERCFGSFLTSFIEAEKLFTERLKVLISTFLLPLRHAVDCQEAVDVADAVLVEDDNGVDTPSSWAGIMTREQVSTVFSNIETIFSLHVDFLGAVQAHFKGGAGTPSDSVGAAMQRLHVGGVLLEADAAGSDRESLVFELKAFLDLLQDFLPGLHKEHSEYATRFGSAYDRLCERFSNCPSLLHLASANGFDDGNDLETLLKLPLVHSFEYERLLSDLRSGLQSCAEIVISPVLSLLNETQQKISAMDRMFLRAIGGSSEVFKGFEFSSQVSGCPPELLSSPNTILNRGPVYDRSLAPLYLFLLPEVLVLTTPPHIGPSGLAYVYRETIDISRSMVEADGKRLFAVEENSGEAGGPARLFGFLCNSTEARDSWVQAVLDAQSGGAGDGAGLSTVLGGDSAPPSGFAQESDSDSNSWDCPSVDKEEVSLAVSPSTTEAVPWVSQRPVELLARMQRSVGLLVEVINQTSLHLSDGALLVADRDVVVSRPAVSLAPFSRAAFAVEKQSQAAAGVAGLASWVIDERSGAKVVVAWRIPGDSVARKMPGGTTVGPPRVRPPNLCEVFFVPVDTELSHDLLKKLLSRISSNTPEGVQDVQKTASLAGSFNAWLNYQRDWPLPFLQLRIHHVPRNTSVLALNEESPSSVGHAPRYLSCVVCGTATQLDDSFQNFGADAREAFADLLGDEASDLLSRFATRSSLPASPLVAWVKSRIENAEHSAAEAVAKRKAAASIESRRRLTRRFGTLRRTVAVPGAAESGSGAVSGGDRTSILEIWPESVPGDLAGSGGMSGVASTNLSTVVVGDRRRSRVSTGGKSEAKGMNAFRSRAAEAAGLCIGQGEEWGVEAAQRVRGQAHAEAVDKEVLLFESLCSLASHRLGVDLPLCEECASLQSLRLGRELEERRDENSRLRAGLDVLVGGTAERAAGLGDGADSRGLQTRLSGVFDALTVRTDSVVEGPASFSSAVSQDGRGDVAVVEALSELDGVERLLEGEFLAAARTLAATCRTLGAAERDSETASSIQDSVQELVNDVVEETFQLQEQVAAIHSKLEYQLRHLETLAHVNALDDVYRIWHDGMFATVSGLRLGRLPSAPIDWMEVNSALGCLAALVDTLALVCNFEFESVVFECVGPMTRVGRRGESGPGLELCGPAGEKGSRRLESALGLLLEAVGELARHLEGRLLDSGQSKQNSVLPYEIGDMCVGRVPMKLHSGNEHIWTRALKYLAIDVKFLVILAARLKVMALPSLPSLNEMMME